MTDFTAEQMVRMRRVQTLALSPDNTWAAVAVQRLDAKNGARYLSDIYRVSLSGGEPTLLTRGEHNDHSPAFLHDGRLAFLSNRPTNLGDDDGHDKRSQVFAFPLGGGDAVCLTDEPLGVSAFRAASTADVLCVCTSQLPDVAHVEQRKTAKERAEQGPSAIVYDDMPVRFWDHWLPNSKRVLVAYVNGERHDLEFDLTSRGAFDLAPSGAFVIAHTGALGDDRMFDQRSIRVDVASGATRELFSAPRVWLTAPVISPDSTRVAFNVHVRVDGKPGVSELTVVEVDSGESETIAVDMEHELGIEGWKPDGSELLAVAAIQATRPALAVDLKTGSVRRITSEESGGSHGNIRIAGDQIVGIRSALTEAPEVFRCAWSGGTPARLTNLAGFEPPEFAVVENHSVVSTDGTPVQYRLVRPAAASGPTPVIMAIHGGPISDWGDVWHWRWNSLLLAARGYAVILPNPRGSVGFGRDFIAGIWNNQWGAQCYEDLMAVADEVEARDDVDGDRMMAMGGSFGGYMTNWIGTQTDRFKCLITHASIFDMRAFHGVTDLPSFWAFSFGVDPWTNRAAFDRYSPIEHVAGWKSPTLVIHGDLDYRVPIGEALALFEALKAHKVESKLLVYPDENHWILKPRNIESWYANVLSWADDYLT